MGTIGMDIDSDRFLVARMLRGDEEAFDSFFDRYFAALFRFTLARIGNDQDAAEEIVQSTMTIAVRRIEGWRGEAALFTWLCTICRHEIGGWLERNNREPVKIELSEDQPAVRAALESLASSEHEPESSMRRRETARLVQATLDLLPSRYGDVLEWKYILGLTVAEIGERLKVSPKAAESSLSRARSAFRDAFETIVAERAIRGES